MIAPQRQPGKFVKRVGGRQGEWFWGKPAEAGAGRPSQSRDGRLGGVVLCLFGGPWNWHRGLGIGAFEGSFFLCCLWGLAKGTIWPGDWCFWRGRFVLFLGLWGLARVWFSPVATTVVFVFCADALAS